MFDIIISRQYYVLCQVSSFNDLFIQQVYVSCFLMFKKHFYFQLFSGQCRFHFCHVIRHLCSSFFASFPSVFSLNILYSNLSCSIPLYLNTWPTVCVYVEVYAFLLTIVFMVGESCCFWECAKVAFCLFC